MTVRKTRLDDHSQRLVAHARRITELEGLVGGMQRTLKAELTINANGPKPAEEVPMMRVSVTMGNDRIEMEGPAGHSEILRFAAHADQALDNMLRRNSPKGPA